MTQKEVDYADVQGLVRFGFGRMTEATYALVRVKDAEAARAWLRTAPVTNAVAMNPLPVTALQIAFTASGLQAFGLPDSVIASFSHEFRAGMTQESRSRQLGDVGESAPACWKWGSASFEPHALMIFLANPGLLASFVQGATGGTWKSAFEEPYWLPTENLGGVEPFGFADGVSQPKPDWEQQRDTASPQFDYTNVVALGEFLLGYRNEYGNITDRPLLDPGPGTEGLLDAQDAPEKKDLGLNGTYLVMRQLHQDVRAFWQFIAGQTGADPAEADKLASSLIGRTRAGDPLAPTRQEAIPGVEAPDATQNQFTFDADPAGAQCPFGAHIRRANPRNSDYPGRPEGLAKLVTMIGLGPDGFRDDLMSPVRFHRIVRRGREYGPKLSPADALLPTPPGDPERGLHFLCLNANISRQFEFLQNAWINSTKFSGLTGESDPLLGNREPLSGCPATANFTLQAEGGLRRTLPGLPRFITVRGGAYFFLPSLRALRFIAGDEAVS